MHYFVKDKTDLLMIYSAENNIIQTNDTLHLWAFLTDINGNRLVNQEVSFYKVKGDVETQIGSGVVTDSKGIASLDYVGGGVGQIGIRAEYGSVVSTPYQVTDCAFLDIATTGKKNSNWNAEDGLTVSDPSDDGTLLTNSQDSGKAYRIKNNSSETLIWNTPFCIEFDVVSFTGTVRTFIRTSSGGSNLDKTISGYLTSNNHIKFVIRENNYDLIVDGEYKNTNTSHSLAQPVSIGFVVSASSNVKYANYEVYPI